jgi:hypothetical protein
MSGVVRVADIVVGVDGKCLDIELASSRYDPSGNLASVPSSGRVNICIPFACSVELWRWSPVRDQ